MQSYSALKNGNFRKMIELDSINQGRKNRVRKSNTMCSLSCVDPSFQFLHMSIDVDVNVEIAHKTRNGTIDICHEGKKEN